MSDNLKAFCVAVCASLALAGCDQGAPKPAETAAAAAAAVAPALTPAARADVLAALTAGKSVTVVFDTCPQSDDGWMGDADPLGTIKCGETYSVKYDATTNKFTATGLNEGNNEKLTEVGDGTSPAEGAISIWGAVFNVGEGGIVIDQKSNVAVGHIGIEG